MAARPKGCGLCKPHKRLGNSAHRFTASVRRLIEKASYRG